MLITGILSLSVLLSVVLSAPSDRAPLRSFLRSPKQTLALYTTYKEQHHLTFPAAEGRERLRLFQENVAKVIECDEFIGSARFAINKFSVMTAEERRGYFGYNVTSSQAPHPPRPQPPPLPTKEHPPFPTGVPHPPIPTKEHPPFPTGVPHPPIPTEAEEHPPFPTGVPNPPIPTKEGPLFSPHPPKPPIQKFWTDTGSVTEVQNQGSCGACWTFAAVGALETRYKELTGVLRKFSEQELLDCVPENGGCLGGYPENGMAYVMDKGRLSPEKYYRYKEESGECKANRKGNALKGARVTKVVNLPSNLENFYISALAAGPIWVATKASDCLIAYTGGIMKDSTCDQNEANHVVTAVGYAPTYFLIKNSWGTDWGEQGFVRFLRGYHNCGLLLHGGYPVLEDSGRLDTSKSDPPAEYTLVEDNECADDMTGCTLSNCDTSIGGQICKKTCSTC